MSDKPIVNPLADDDWSDDDIRNRTETMLGAEFNRQRIDVLNRQITAALVGKGPPLTPSENAEVDAYGTRAYVLGLLADAARADMAALRACWVAERGETDPGGLPPRALEFFNLRAAARPAPVQEEPQ